MTSTDLRAALARLGLTQSEAARLMGVHLRTVQRWCGDEIPVPPTVERLISVMESGKVLKTLKRMRD